MDVKEALSLFDWTRNGVDVADVLLRLGVVGIKRTPGHCPMANYLTEYTGRPCSVTGEGKPFDPTQGVLFDADPPLSVQRFVWEFDHGAYPMLEA